MRSPVLASFALALLVAPAGCAAKIDSTSTGPGTSDPISTTDTSACGPDAVASVIGSGFRIFPMVADGHGIVLGLAAGDPETPHTLVASLPTGASDFTTVYESNEESLRQLTADASEVYTFATSATQGTSVVDRIPRSGGASSVVLAANPGQLVSRGAPDGSTMYVPVDGSILAIPANGGAPKTIYTTNASVVQVLVDGQTLYWSEGSRPVGYLTVSASAMYEAPIADELVPTELKLPAGIAGPAAVEDGVVAVSVLTAESEGQLVAVSGGGASRTLDTMGPVMSWGINPVAVWGGNAYYSLDGVTLREVPLDGSAPPRTLANSTAGVRWIGVGAGGTVYYASSWCVYRAPA